jgi:hypothetical protein
MNNELDYLANLIIGSTNTDNITANTIHSTNTANTTANTIELMNAHYSLMNDANTTGWIPPYKPI